MLMPQGMIWGTVWPPLLLLLLLLEIRPKKLAIW